MLINFTVSNFLSFDEPVSLSLEAGRKTSRHENHVRKVGDVSVLRGAIIYGANASGKSNILKAIDAFSNMVYNGTCKPCRGMQFVLKNPIRPDIEFDVVFSSPEIDENEIDIKRIFRYVLSTDGVTVKHERLSLVENDSEQMLYDRTTGKEIEFGGAVKKHEWYRQRTLTADALYLSKLKADGLFENLETIQMGFVFSGAYFGLIALWVIGTNIRSLPKEFQRLVLQDEFKEFLKRLLKRADVGVSDLTWESIPQKEAEIIALSHPIEENGNLMVDVGQSFVLLHRDANGVSGEEFRLVHNGTPMKAGLESDGTIRLVRLAPMLYWIWKGLGTWLIDEADSRMHPLLTRHLLKAFMDLPESKAQIVITAHDTNLMTHDIWRTDEVWFVEKRLDGSSDLYSLYNFQPRHDKKLDKGYLQGLYGALPCLGGEMVDGE